MDLNTFLSSPPAPVTPTVPAGDSGGFNPLATAYNAITENPLTTGLLSLGDKINTGLGKVSGFMGSPMQDAPFSSQVRSVVAPPGHYNEDLYGMDPFAKMSNRVETELGPRAHEFYTAGIGTAGEITGRMAVDPVMYVPFGALAKLGPQGRALGTMISAGFAGQMGMAGTQAAQQVWDEVQKNGVTPEAVAKGVEALSSFGFAGLGAYGTYAHGKMNVADYQNRGGTMERMRRLQASGKGRDVSELPGQPPSAAAEPPMQNLAPEGGFKVTEYDPAEAASLAEKGEVLSDSRDLIKPIPQETRDLVTNAFKQASETLNKTILENNAKAREGVAYNSDGTDMPETFGVDASNQAPIPKEQRVTVLDKKTAAALSKHLAKKGINKTPEELLDKVAFAWKGNVYIGKQGVSRVLMANDAEGVVRNAEQVLSHEMAHGNQRENTRKQPQARYDEITGEQLEPKDARLKETGGGHYGGRWNDDFGKDVSHGGITTKLVDALQSDPKWKNAARAFSENPLVEGSRLPEGTQLGSGGIEPDVNALIEIGTGKGAGVGGRKFRGGELREPTAEKGAGEGTARIEEIGDNSAQVNSLIDKLEGLTGEARKTRLQELLDKYEKAGALARTDFKEVRAKAAKGERMEPPPQPAEPVVEKMAPPPGLQQEAKPPAVENAPEGKLVKPFSRNAKDVRRIIMSRGHKGNAPVNHEERFALIEWLAKNGGINEKNPALKEVTPQEIKAFFQTVRSYSPEHSKRLGSLLATTKAFQHRNLGTNARLVKADLAGGGEAYANLPKSSREGAVPARSIYSTIAETAQAARERLAEARQGTDPKAMISAVEEIQDTRNFLKRAIDKWKSRWSTSQTKAAENLVRSVDKAGVKTVAVADRKMVRETKRTEATQRVTAKEKVEAEIDALREELSRVKKAAEVPAQPKVERRVERVRAVKKPSPLEEMEAPVEKRLTSEEAIAEAKKLAEEIRLGIASKTIPTTAEAVETRRKQDIADRRSIAARDSDRGKKSRSSTFTKQGEVKQGKDIIGSAARKLKAGVKKVLPRKPQGKLVEGELTRITPEDGSLPYYTGKTVQGTEASRRGSITKGPEVLGDVIKGITKGVGAGKTVFSKEGQVGTEPPVPEVPKDIAEARRGTQKALEADREAHRLKGRAYLESIRGKKFPENPIGKPLTEGTVSREGARKPILPKEYVRAGAARSQYSPLQRLITERSELYKRITKLNKVFDDLDKKGVEYTESEIIDKMVERGSLSRVDALELRGKSTKQLKAMADAANEEALAYSTMDVTDTARPEIKAKLEVAKNKFVKDAVATGMEGWDSAIDQLHEAGRLHTLAEHKASLKKFGKGGGYWDFYDEQSRGIDLDQEYYVNPADRARRVKALEGKAHADFETEMGTAEEAPSIAARGSLKAKLSTPSRLPPQMIPRGSKANPRPVPKPREFDKHAPDFIRDKYVERRVAEGLTKEQALAKWNARPAYSPTLSKESYPDLVSGGTHSFPDSLVTESPKRVFKTGQKGGKNLEEGLDSADIIHSVRSGGEGLIREPFGVETGLAKIIRKHNENVPMSKAVKLMLEGIHEGAKESHSKDLDVRLGEGGRPVGQPVGLSKETKFKVGKIIREAKTGGEFNSRLDGLIDSLVESKELVGGKAIAKFRSNARARLSKEKTKSETPLQVAKRTLGIKPPPGYKIEEMSAGPTKKASAPSGSDPYEEAGKATRKGHILNAGERRRKELVKKIEKFSGVLKTSLTGFDISNPLRNTYLLTTGAMFRNNASRRQLATSIKEMVGSYSEAKFKKYDAELRARPIYEAAKKAGLRLSDTVSDHENFMGTDWIGRQIHKGQKLGPYNPIKWAAELGEKGVLGAGRAYTHYQNKIMLDTFEKGMEYVKATSPGGINPTKAREMTDMVNMFGSRSKVTNATIEKIANITFFSPQMIKSAGKTLSQVGLPFETGQYLGKTLGKISGGRRYETKAVREFGHQHARSGIAFGAAALALIYGGAKMSGLNPSIETDPRSKDFLKVRVGHTSVNPWGPYQQYLVLGAQLALGEEKLRGSGRVQKVSGMATTGRFLRGKLSPIVGSAASYVEETDGAGRETTSVKGRLRLAADTVSPIMAGDVVSIYQENPAAFATGLVALASLGMGVQSGTAGKGWMVGDAMRQQDVRVSDEIRRLGIEGPHIGTRIGLRGKNAVGQKLYYSLKPDEREQFTNEVMPIISEDLDKFISSERYKTLTTDAQRRLLYRAIKRENARYSASKRLKLKYKGATPVNQWWEAEE